MNIRPEIFPGRVGARADLAHEVAASSDPTAIRQTPGRGRPGSSWASKRWVVAALTVVFVPKCLLCIVGYGAAGGVAVELCGGVEKEGPMGWWVGPAAGASILLVGAWIRWGRGGSVSGAGHPTR